MKKLQLLLPLFILFSCTKEVPEFERNISKSADEAAIAEIIENYTKAYNDGDIETATSFFSADFTGYAAESEKTSGIKTLEKELREFRNQYPDGKWKYEIEEIAVDKNLAYVILGGSFLTPNPIEGDMSPSYSERSLKILRKDKTEGWKISRSFSFPEFTYN